MNRIPLLLLTIAVLCLSLITKAQSLTAHTHGLAMLSLAEENGIVDLQLESPAANLLGFEHAAQTDKEKQRLQEVDTRLRASKTLFSFGHLSCEPLMLSIDHLGAPDKHHAHKHSDHESSADHSHRKTEHSDFNVTYRFNCGDGNTVTSFSTSLFQQFPGIEKIKLAWVTSTAQGAGVLSSKSNTIKLK